MKKILISLIAVTVVAGIYAISSASEAQFPAQTQNVYYWDTGSGTYKPLDSSVARSNYAAKQRVTETEYAIPVTKDMVNNFCYVSNFLRLEIDDTYLEWWYRGIPKKLVADDIGLKIWSPATTTLYFTGCADLKNKAATGIKPADTWAMPAYYDLVEAARYPGYEDTQGFTTWPMPPKPPFEAGTPVTEGWRRAADFNGGSGDPDYVENTPGYTIFYALWAGVDIANTYEIANPANKVPFTDIYEDSFQVTLAFTLP